MSHTVHFTPEARDQLDELENHIAGRGSPIVAARYIDAIVDYCESLLFRTGAHGAMTFGRACGRLGIVGA